MNYPGHICRTCRPRQDDDSLTGSKTSTFFASVVQCKTDCEQDTFAADTISVQGSGSCLASSCGVQLSMADQAERAERLRNIDSRRRIRREEAEAHLSTTDPGRLSQANVLPTNPLEPLRQPPTSVLLSASAGARAHTLVTLQRLQADTAEAERSIKMMIDHGVETDTSERPAVLIKKQRLRELQAHVESNLPLLKELEEKLAQQPKELTPE